MSDENSASIALRVSCRDCHWSHEGPPVLTMNWATMHEDATDHRMDVTPTSADERGPGWDCGNDAWLHTCGPDCRPDASADEAPR